MEAMRRSSERFTNDSPVVGSKNPTEYQLAYFVFFFNELTLGEKNDALSRMKRGTESIGVLDTIADDYIRLLHLFKEPKLGMVWADISRRVDVQKNFGVIVDAFNDYVRHRFENVAVRDVQPDAELSSDFMLKCMQLDPNNKFRPLRDVAWLQAEIAAMRKDLIAANFLRFERTFGSSVSNPYSEYESLATHSPSQLYALILFNDFLPLTVDAPSAIIDESAVTWRHFEKAFVNGAIRAKCRYCSSVFHINVAAQCAHLFGPSVGGFPVPMCSKIPNDEINSLCIEDWKGVSAMSWPCAEEGRPPVSHAFAHPSNGNMFLGPSSHGHVDPNPYANMSSQRIQSPSPVHQQYMPYPYQLGSPAVVYPTYVPASSGSSARPGQYPHQFRGPLPQDQGYSPLISSSNTLKR